MMTTLAKQLAAKDLMGRMAADGHPLPDGYVFTQEVRYTDADGMDCSEQEYDNDEEATAWWRFSDGTEGILVRFDDDKFHSLTDEEWGYGDDDQSYL